MSERIATTVWTISPDLVRTLEDRLGSPVDSYLNGSQTWLVEIGATGATGSDEDTLEFRLHPVAGYTLPQDMSHYDLWESVVTQLATGIDPHALHLGREVRPLTALWDGLECYAAYGEEIEPQLLAATATERLGIPPDGVGLVDHAVIGDAWERANGKVSIVALVLEQLAT